MVRILSTEGASAISAFEEGLIPTPQGYSPAEFWWDIADKNSDVYIRELGFFQAVFNNLNFKQIPFVCDT